MVAAYITNFNRLGVITWKKRIKVNLASMLKFQKLNLIDKVRKTFLSLSYHESNMLTSSGRSHEELFFKKITCSRVQKS